MMKICGPEQVLATKLCDEGNLKGGKSRNRRSEMGIEGKNIENVYGHGKFVLSKARIEDFKL